MQLTTQARQATATVAAVTQLADYRRRIAFDFQAGGRNVHSTVVVRSGMKEYELHSDQQMPVWYLPSKPEVNTPFRPTAWGTIAWGVLFLLILGNVLWWTYRGGLPFNWQEQLDQLSDRI